MSVCNERDTIDTFEFTPLTKADIEIIHQWFNAPHARQWFGGGKSLAVVVDELAEYLDENTSIRAYIVKHAGRPIGMINWERMGDTPSFQRAYEVDDPDTVNCDMIIGEADAAHRGLGAAMLRQFLANVVFVDHRLHSCVIDPVPDNAIAIRMYEKAGFRFLRALPEDGEGNSVYLMELTREELYSPPSTAMDFYIRPAREDELSSAVDIDDDACELFEEAGFDLELDELHPFVQKEEARWANALHSKRLLFACSAAGEQVGFIAVSMVDNVPFIEQVSVRQSWMKRGIGSALVARAKAWSVREGELWLTTYGDAVAWNKPWYERLGFVAVADDRVGSELRGRIAEERMVLPRGDERLVMVFRHRNERPVEPK